MKNCMRLKWSERGEAARLHEQNYENLSGLSHNGLSFNCNGASPGQNVCDGHNNRVCVTTTSYQHTHKHHFPISLSHTDRPLLRDCRIAKLHDVNNVILGHQLSSSGEGNE